MDTDIFPQPLTGLHKTPDAFASLLALRKSNSNRETPDKLSPGPPPHAGFDDCARSRRARSCIRPAFPRPNGQTVNDRDHGPARSLRPDPRSTTTLARSSG